MLKRLKKFLTPLNLFVLLVLLVALFVRVYRVDQILAFHYDQGRDALVIWDLINKGKLFLIGPVTGIAGIFRGPFYYYLMAPFYFLGKGSPIWPSVFLAITSVFGLGLMYYLAKKVGGTVSGIIALILGGFSFEIIYASRWLSNPTPMLFLSMILVWSLFMISEGKKKFWWVVAGVLGLSLFHFGAASELFYFPAVAIFAVWQRKNLPDKKTFWISVGVFILTVLPLALFDVRHGGILGGNIKGFLGESGAFSLPPWRFVADRFALLATYFSQLIFHHVYEKESIFLFALFLSFVYSLSRFLVNDKFKIILLLFLSPVIGLIFFQGNYGNFYQYYLTGYYLIFLILVAVTLGHVSHSSWFGKALVAIFLIFFLSKNYSDLMPYLKTTGSEPTAIVLAGQVKAINWIYRDAGARKFNVDVYVPPVIPYSYDYLFKWLPNNYKVESQVPLPYTLYEIDPPHPERLKAWLDRQKGIGRVIKEEKFGGITVQERERFKK